MEGKIIIKGEGVQEKIISGVVKAVDAISTTLGPAGKCVAIDCQYGSDITRDGATVAKGISFSDPQENMGAELVKNAASKTEELAGDSTTTTSLLIKEYCLKGQKAISNGANVTELKIGMFKARDWMEKYIKEHSIPIDGDLEKVKKVATISANNDKEIGDLVVDCMSKVGIDGLITADMTSGLDTFVEITTGMKIERGWSSPQYITEPAEGKCTMEKPYVLVAGEKLSSMNQLIHLLEDYQQNAQGAPLLIICDDIDENVNTTFVYNVLRGALRCCVVKGIDFGDGRKNIMADIATVVGADFICPENGLTVSSASLKNLGRANKVVISRDNCIIFEGCGDPNEIRDRAEILKKAYENASSSYDRSKFEKRIASLVGGIAIIRAGGASDAEKLNKKATIEDSILASRCAIEEGCVPGGGYLYFKGAKDVQKDKAFWKDMTESEKEGAEIVFKSLPIVLKTIAENSGVSGDVVIDKISSTSKENFGYNAKTKKYCNLIEDGILDSAKSLRVSLENSISAASMVLMTDCVVFDEPKKCDCGCDGCSCKI